MTKIKKLISAMVTGCMIVSALMMHVGAVNAQSNDSLLNNNLHSTSTSQAEAILNNAIYRDYLIRVGEYQANDDGSYSFTRIASTATRSANGTLAKEVLTLIPNDDATASDITDAVAVMRANNSTRLEDTDAAGCLTAYCVINWKTSNVGGAQYAALTSVSCGYKSQGSTLGSGVSVASQSLMIGQTGFTTGKYVTQQKPISIATSSKSYTCTPPTSWAAVEVESGTAIIGATYTINLKRGTSSHTWGCTITNNI